MTQIQLISLLERYHLGALTKEEHSQLIEQLIKDEHGLQVPEVLAFLLDKDNASKSYDSDHWDPILAKVLSIDVRGSEYIPKVQRIHFLRRGFFKYAVAIIIFFGIGTYLFTKNNSAKKEITYNKPIILKAEEKIMLTLSDGKQIVLDDSSIENISDGKILISKTNGILHYNTVLTSGTNTAYNTMTTPKGGQYQLVLPDGSKVWLNAASSIKYPIVFTEKVRQVELVGEAYFEIKENKTKPFIVSALNTSITVLGTKFNVNAYKDEPGVQTTLINGSVKVSNQKNDVIIKPGQQISVDYNNEQMNITQPDTEDVLAWKEGMFQFENKNIKSIMRQLERWYDITVEYKGAVTDAEFSGSLSRTENALMLLDALSLTRKVHFKIEGKKILVFSGAVSK